MPVPLAAVPAGLARHFPVVDQDSAEGVQRGAPVAADADDGLAHAAIAAHGDALVQDDAAHAGGEPGPELHAAVRVPD
eukprot:6057429-Pyramimonas_sp.AAC.1